MASYFIIRGPCRLEWGSRVDVEVNGGRPDGTSLVVPTGRSYLVRVEGGSIEGNCSLHPVSSEVYESYRSASSKASEYGRRILIVGPSDTGKSTLASFTVNMGGGSLLTVDLGQNELYAPGFEALLLEPGFYVPGSVRGEVRRCFVGSFTPSRAPLEYLGCAGRLASHANDRLVVDTDGWVSRWEGLLSKASLAAVVGADVVVGVGLDRIDIEALEASTGLPVLSLPPLARGVTKSRDERRTHRDRLIAKRLQGSRMYSVSVDDLIVIGLPVFHGKPLDRDGLEALGVRGSLYAETHGGTLVIVSRYPPPRQLGATWLKPGWERGLLAAVDCGEGVQEVALIDSINYRQRRIKLLSPCMPKMLWVGRVRVSIDSYV
ncbi:MAG: hypothetical protein F7C35_07050 [Desulfurococcales archaeon]|nr:hypothetical protein [Desulfurococcales archaeon]